MLCYRVISRKTTVSKLENGEFLKFNLIWWHSQNLGLCKCNKPNGIFFHNCHTRNNSNFWATNKLKTNAIQRGNKFVNTPFKLCIFWILCWNPEANWPQVIFCFCSNYKSRNFRHLQSKGYCCHGIFCTRPQIT